MSEGAIPRSMPGFQRRDVGSEVVLFNERSANVTALNELAAKIYDLCDGDKSVADIVSEISEQYQVDRARVERDVGKTIKLLEEQGIIAVDSGVEGS